MFINVNFKFKCFFNCFALITSILVLRLTNLQTDTFLPSQHLVGMGWDISMSARYLTCEILQ